MKSNPASSEKSKNKSPVPALKANTPDAGEPEEHWSEAAIDQTLADSFPASDPPAWTLGVRKPEPKRQPASPPEPPVIPRD